MKIKTVSLQNFFSHQVSTLNLENRGLLFVEGDNQDTGGSNAAGKSSIFDGIRWCLYGQVSRDISKSGVSRNGKGDCLVYTNLEVNNVDVKIYRYREHSTYGSKVLVYLNDVSQTLGKNSDTQEFINETLGIGDSGFCSAVMFPQGGTGFSSFTDGAQKDILDGILKTGRFSKAQERAKELAAKLYQQITGISAQITLAERDIKSRKQQLEQLLSSHEEFEKKKAREVQKLEDLFLQSSERPPTIDPKVAIELAQLNALPKVQDSKLTEYTQACIAIQNLDVSIAELSGQLAQIRVIEFGIVPAPPTKNSSDYDSEVRALTKRITEVNKLVGPNQSRIDQLTKDIAELNEGICPTCRQPINVASRTSATQTKTNERARLNIQIADLKKTLADAENELQNVQDMQTGAKIYEDWQDNQTKVKERDALQARKVRQQQQHITLQIKKQELENLNQEYSARITRINELHATQAEFEVDFHEWEDDLRATLKLINEEKAKVSPSLQAIEQLGLSNVITQLETGVKFQTAIKKELEYKVSVYEFWVKGFGNQGIRNYVIDNKLPYLNLKIAEYISYLTNDTANVHVSSQKQLASGESRDKISVAIQNPFGADGYGGSSGGERRRVDIATLFALGDLAALESNAQVELRLLDEPFESLDGPGNEQVVRLLNQLVVPRSKTVLVMSHDDQLKPLFQNSIRVVKKNGISRIEDN